MGFPISCGRGLAQASVHRPRQSNVSVIQRENQQRYAQQMQQQCNQQINSDFAITGQFMENNRHRFQHSMAVTIPHQQKNQLQPTQSYHNQAPNQQSQPKLIVSQQHQQQSNSRISSSATSVSTNFNQISKTATSLLNEIYEKHLLSQTTFENVNAASVNICRGIASGSGQQPDADHNFNNLCQQVSHPIHQQYHNIRSQQSSNVELNVHRNTLHYASVGENVANGGAGDGLVQRNVKTRMPKRTNENLPMKMQKNAKYLCDSKQSIASGRKYPLDANEPGLYEISYVQRSKTDVNLFYGGSDLGAMQSKQFTSDVNGKISVRAEPVGGNFYYQDNVYGGCSSIGNSDSVGLNFGAGNGVVSGAVNNKYENRNSKINIMLETAQAMAAAAYFARFNPVPTRRLDKTG
ncbi:hypothetical protein Bhyg_04331 [Pseudolycoriella hygida]|uniref:Uncharacterized protein n=1 Tax=Pseudolycoriella hygida TaxID=35572 RepID=A0A9Q0NF54_9DIPT|nr:hypothetical protein Bhyg_04331 [Pseudolycoriella hygida]